MHRLHRRLPYKGHHRPALPDTRKCISYLTIALKTAIPSSSERPSVIASTALTTASSSAHRTSLRARPRCTILSEEMGWIQQRWWSFLHGQKRTLTNDCKAARSGALGMSDGCGILPWLGECGVDTESRSCDAITRSTSERDSAGACNLGAGAVAFVMQNEHQSMLAPDYIDAWCVHGRFGSLTMRCALKLR